MRVVLLLLAALLPIAPLAAQPRKPRTAADLDAEITRLKAQLAAAETERQKVEAKKFDPATATAAEVRARAAELKKRHAANLELGEKTMLGRYQVLKQLFQLGEAVGSDFPELTGSKTHGAMFAPGVVGYYTGDGQLAEANRDGTLTLNVKLHDNTGNPNRMTMRVKGVTAAELRKNEVVPLKGVFEVTGTAALPTIELITQRVAK